MAININVPGGGVDTLDATAKSSDILSGKTAYVDDVKITGSIQTKSAATITPGQSSYTIKSGQYLGGDQTVKGDSNLSSSNIKSGVSIFGVYGSLVPLDIKNASSTTVQSTTAITSGNFVGYSNPAFSISSSNYINKVCIISGYVDTRPDACVDTGYGYIIGTAYRSSSCTLWVYNKSNANVSTVAVDESFTDGQFIPIDSTRTLIVYYKSYYLYGAIIKYSKNNVSIGSSTQLCYFEIQPTIIKKVGYYSTSYLIYFEQQYQRMLVVSISSSSISVPGSVLDLGTVTYSPVAAIIQPNKNSTHFISIIGAYSHDDIYNNSSFNSTGTITLGSSTSWITNGRFQNTRAGSTNWIEIDHGKFIQTYWLGTVDSESYGRYFVYGATYDVINNIANETFTCMSSTTIPAMAVIGKCAFIVYRDTRSTYELDIVDILSGKILQSSQIYAEDSSNDISVSLFGNGTTLYLISCNRSTYTTNIYSIGSDIPYVTLSSNNIIGVTKTDIKANSTGTIFTL